MISVALQMGREEFGDGHLAGKGVLPLVSGLHNFEGIGLEKHHGPHGPMGAMGPMGFMARGP